MSTGPLGGVPASAAGSPLAQTKGPDTEMAQQEQARAERRAQSNQRAENAAGVGEADGEDHQTAERDADGRRLWEENPAGGHKETPQQQGRPGDPPRSRDASGQRGNLLDLSG